MNKWLIPRAICALNIGLGIFMLTVNDWFEIFFGIGSIVIGAGILLAIRKWENDDKEALAQYHAIRASHENAADKYDPDYYDGME